MMKVLLALAGLATPDPDMCLSRQSGVTPKRRVDICTTLIRTGDPKLQARFHNGRGSAHRDLKDAAARADYDRAIALDPANATFLANNGILTYEYEDYAASIAYLDRALALRPDDPVVLTDRSDSHYMLDDYEDALRDLDRAMQVEAPTKARLYKKGRILVEMARYRQAVPVLTAALAIDPDDVDVIERRSTAYAMLGERNAAFADAKRLLALRPNDAGVHSKFCSHYMLSDPDLALTHCDKALAIDPGRAEAWDNRSVIREDKGDMAGARVDQDRAVSLWPREPTFRSNRGMRSIRLGEFDRAQADVDAGLARAPEEAALLSPRPQLRLIAGEGAKAEALLRQVLADEPDQPAALCALGWRRLAENRSSDARVLFERTLADRPRPRDELRGRRLRWQALYGRGLARLRGGDPAGGQTDVAAARSLQADVDAIVARQGFTP